MKHILPALIFILFLSGATMASPPASSSTTNNPDSTVMLAQSTSSLAAPESSIQMLIDWLEMLIL